MGIVWAVVGVVVLLVLVGAWRMDRAVQRRGSRASHHSDLWYEVRESRRDVDAMNPCSSDSSWTSWSRRNQRR
ncbi:hypothetical protein GCU67_02330 [Modestobacter muralis]|uniref:Uncharacterized protein n=1 Tax=Modestobacter muralis TaxID=1608614 RepID=A0A6P0H237_9ACTN|nr:hypothetical protein [Modestobacter muralis]NEK93013.1 hypothetical protein [Modestobacter muralis]NEN49780.1 hypothetical protein [Modestobacter muralis]